MNINPGNPKGLGSIRSPLHKLNGTITPNGLHFVRLHSGVPDIDPDKHKLLIHGLVDRPLIFTLDTLAKYPMESRIYFLECGGNSQTLYQRKPIQAGVTRIHGQVCCSDWTGVRLSTLLEETGVKPNAKWIVAEGADAAGMARSCRYPRSWTTRSSRSTRTASGSAPRTAIRCGCSCPAIRATRR